jgi:hypothetical protein
MDGDRVCRRNLRQERVETYLPVPRPFDLATSTAKTMNSRHSMDRKEFGEENVPVIEVILPVTCQLYRNVFKLEVGQHFDEASIAPKQTAHYQTLSDGRAIPVEALGCAANMR